MTPRTTSISISRLVSFVFKQKHVRLNIPVLTNLSDNPKTRQRYESAIARLFQQIDELFDPDSKVMRLAVTKGKHTL